MPFDEGELERNTDAARAIIQAALAPWGGSEACIDAYEAGIRTATEVQLRIARTLDVGPVRTLAAACADITRDIGATQVSSARWFLDL